MKKRFFTIITLIFMLISIVGCSPVETIDYSEQINVVGDCQTDKTDVVKVIKTYKTAHPENQIYCDDLLSQLDIIAKALNNFASANVYVDTMHNFGIVNGITKQDDVIIIEQTDYKILLERTEFECDIKVVKEGNELENYNFKFSQDKKDFYVTMQKEGEIDVVFEYVQGKYLQILNKISSKHIELCLGKNNDEVVGFSFRLIVNESGTMNSLFDGASTEGFGVGLSSIKYNY